MTLDTERVRRKIAYIRQQVSTINNITKTYSRIPRSAIRYYN